MSPALETRMLSGEPFTYASMGATMEVDRAIQRLRKRGLIAFHREGRKIVWKAVNGGARLSKTPLALAQEALIEWKAARLRTAHWPGGSDHDREFLVVVGVAIKKAIG